MDNSFAMSDLSSVSRFKLLARFYSPGFSKQLLIYLSASLLFAILILMPFPYYAQVGIFTMISTAMALMVQMAPVVLAKSGDSRVIEKLIPASPSEKFLLFAVYFFIIIPLAVYVLPEAALGLYQKIPAIQTQDMLILVKIHQNNPAIIVIMNIINASAAIATCLYVVIRVRRNRVIWGILSVFACNIALGIIGAIYGAASLFKEGYEAGRAGLDLDAQQNVEHLLSVMVGETGYTVTVISIVAVYLVSILYVTYRHIKNSNI